MSSRVRVSWLSAELLIQFGEACRRTHVDPAAVMAFPGDDTFGDGSVEQRAHLHHRPSRHRGEEVGREHARAGVGQRRAEARARVMNDFAIETKVAARVLWRIGNKDEMRPPAGQCERALEVPVAPDVAVDHEKGLVAEQRQRVGDAAGGFQRTGRFRRIADRQAELCAVAQRIDDLLAEVRVVDDHVAKAAGGEAFEVPDDQRFAAGHQ